MSMGEWGGGGPSPEPSSYGSGSKGGCDKGCTILFLIIVIPTIALGIVNIGLAVIWFFIAVVVAPAIVNNMTYR